MGTPGPREHHPRHRRGAELRLAVGVLLTALVAFIGALVLGEYEFSGTLPFFAGPLFGLILAEVLVSVGDQRSRLVGVLGAALAAGGLLLAGWFDSSSGIEPMKWEVYAAMALGGLAAALRGGVLGQRRAAAQSSSDR